MLAKFRGARGNGLIYSLSMVMRVEQVDGEFRVVLTAEAMAALHLTEGAAVEVRPVDVANTSQHSYVSVEEGLASFRKTEPLHRSTYLELAK